MTTTPGKRLGRYVGVDEYINTNYTPTEDALTLVVAPVWLGGNGPLIESADGTFAFPYDRSGRCAYRIAGQERITDFHTTELRNRWLFIGLTLGDNRAVFWARGERVDVWDPAPTFSITAPLLVYRLATGFLVTLAVFTRRLTDGELAGLWNGGHDDGFAPEVSLPRGARVDLHTSETALEKLLAIYRRDLAAGTVSDEAIAAINTVVRSLQGALEKIAHEINMRFTEPQANKPYFPITADKERFVSLLNHNLPGLHERHPEISGAIERQQPYHRDQRHLARLKPLYRENHHHDFTMQHVQRAVSWEHRRDGQAVAAIYSRALDVSPAATLFQGIPVGRKQASDGRAITEWSDWYFTDLDASVFGTLRLLHNLCVKACFEVWESTGL